MQFPLSHLVWNCLVYRIWRLWSAGWRLLLVQRPAELCLWAVGIRCHSKKNDWPKERHNKVHVCWVWFVLCLWLIWEDLSLSWGVLYRQTDVCLFFCDTSFGSVEVDLFIGSRPHVDELFFNFVLSAATPSVPAIFTDVFVLNFVSLASSQQYD